MKKVCIISIDIQNGILISEILENLFPQMFDISIFSIKKEPQALFDFDIILYTSEEIRNKLSMYKDLSHAKLLYVQMSFKKENFKKLGQLTNEHKALFVSNNEGSTREIIEALISLGIKRIELYPYYPGIQNAPLLRTAITTHNELSYVPGFVEEVIDIGNRGIEPFVLLQLMTKLDLLDQKTLRVIKEYASTYIFMFEGYFNLCIETVSNKIKLKEIVNNMKDSIILCQKDGHIEFANQRSEAIFNLPADYLRGKEILSILSDYQISEVKLEDGFENVIIILGKSYFLRIMSDHFSEDIIVILSDLNEIKNIENKSKNFLKAGHRAKYTFHNIIGKSKTIIDVIDKAKKFAKSELPILIEGESGTGKELLAGAIHNYSNRSGCAFVAFNCGAMNESLIESELFGYENGAFTGASRKGKIGLFEIANGGTVFLDEIGDMPLSLQVKLLRVLQEKEMIRVGGTDIIHVNIRIIAATNRDLQSMVTKGEFRKDLYYRICTLSLRMPELKARRDDLDLLMHYFKEKHNVTFSLTDRAYQYLYQYTWPGNIRELENFIQYIKVIEKSTADITDFPNNMIDTPKKNKSAIDHIDEHILKTLNDQQNGMGRRTLFERLKEQGFICSEMLLRKKLHALQEMGFIEIATGRKGTALTEDGKNWIDTCSARDNWSELD
ncbi:sigma 54-interacting transcriptional regulator [Ihubacter sp. mB4P-1]|uniref:sigma 54-interacting transcriptional regulator n=1 Tax=Ihubacter sp. mB4P-1 TaxID=3242370 RepID=UPI001379B691